MATRWTAFSLVVLLCWLAPLAGQPGADEWKYDIVYLKSGATFRGLVTENNSSRVEIRCISRKPGSPTVVNSQYFLAKEVERVVLLDPHERDRLQKRLQALKAEYKMLDAQLKALTPGSRPDHPVVDSIVLQPAAWPANSKRSALSYQSSHFQLLSDGRQEQVHLAAIHLEQVYAAYARSLPPRHTKAQPTTILLVGSRAEYQQILSDRGLNFFNQAFYDIRNNQVVCGSDLQRLGDELEKSRASHAKLSADLEERIKELHTAYKGRIPTELLSPIREGRELIRKTEERNTAVFTLARSRLFQRLYHEAFHAYLNTWVYPAGEFEVPLWLNEGLAQIFETAIFELGELRVGHADEDRLKAIRTAIQKNTLLPLKELLRSSPAQFQVAHRSAPAMQVSDRHYLASWGLSFYLTFDRKVLGKKAMDDYVRSLKRGTDPLLAFQELVGKPLPAFEKDYLNYLKSLRPDGTARGNN